VGSGTAVAVSAITKKWIIGKTIKVGWANVFSWRSLHFLVGSGIAVAVSAIAKKNGLLAKLSKLDGLTYLVGVHCIVHTLYSSS
jgi:hypothetical protein